MNTIHKNYYQTKTYVEKNLPRQVDHRYDGHTLALCFFFLMTLVTCAV